MTNADRIRNMSDEELAKFIQKREYTCFVDFIGYADKDCGQGKISAKIAEQKHQQYLNGFNQKQNRRKYHDKSKLRYVWKRN